MANPSFIDAIDEFRRRSALVGRPAEKAAMDKSLRENAIRRLTTTRDRVAPVTPAISEVVQGGGEGAMTPQGLDMGNPQGSQGVPSSISGVQAGVIGQNTADTIEGVLASMLGFEKGEQGYQPSKTMPLSMLSFLQPSLIQKGLQVAKPLVQTVLSQGQEASDAPPDVDAISGPLGGTISSQGDPVGYGGYFGPTPAPTPAPAPSQGGESPTVLCTELYRQGLIPLDIYLADSRYGAKLPKEVVLGYQAWAIPLSKGMARSKVLTSIVAPFVQAWAWEMAYRENVLSKGNWLGKVLSFIGEPVCGFIGRSFNNGYEPIIH